MNRPPKIPTPARINGIFAGIVGGAVLLGGAAVLFFFNPSTHSFYPVCQFHQLTGLNCPGCGATRALYALLHGNLGTALRDNALFIGLLVAGAGRGIWLTAQKRRGRPGALIPAGCLWPLLALTLVFTVLRNLPAFSFLSPA